MQRTKLLVCTVKGCPEPESEEWHRCWVRAYATGPQAVLSGGGRLQCFGGISHQHIPKRSRGGKQIQACYCIGHHDRIDNGDWQDYIAEDKFGQKWWYVQDLHGVTLARHEVSNDTDIRERQDEDASATGAGDSAAASLPGDVIESVQGSVPESSASVAEYQRTSLSLAELTLEQWGERLRTLAGMHRSLGFWLGDAMVYGEDHFGPKAWQYADQELGIAQETLMNYASVCRAIPPSRRRDVSYSVHAEIAPVFREDDVRGQELLDRAEAEGMGVRDIRAELRPSVERTKPQPAQAYELLELMITGGGWHSIDGTCSICEAARKWLASRVEDA